MRGKFILASLFILFIALLIYTLHTERVGDENVNITSNLCKPTGADLDSLINILMENVNGVLTLAIDEEYYSWLKNNVGWIEIQFLEKREITVLNESISAEKILVFGDGVTVLAIYDGKRWHCYGVGVEFKEVLEMVC